MRALPYVARDKARLAGEKPVACSQSSGPAKQESVVGRDLAGWGTKSPPERLLQGHCQEGSPDMARRALIVEDEPLIANDLEGTLRKLGFDVCGLASNPGQAFENSGVVCHRARRYGHGCAHPRTGARAPVCTKSVADDRLAEAIAGVAGWTAPISPAFL
jgi:hypothetical protein